jgi:hypothetical protein
MTADRKFDYTGSWIPLVCFLVSGLAVFPESPYRSWVQHVLGVPHQGDSPSWHLAKRVATGISAGSGLLLILVLTAFTWRESRYWTAVGAFQALLVLMYPITYAVALLWRCLNLIDPTKADLLMRDNALEDRSFLVGFCSALAFGIFVSVVDVIRRLRLRRSNHADGAPGAMAEASRSS